MKYYIGVDVGGTYIKFALVDTNGNIHHFHKLSTPVESPRDEIIELIVKGIRLCAWEMKVPVEMVGIGVPGCVDFDKGVIHTLTNIPGWDNTPLGEILEKKLDWKVWIDNDVNVMALGELYYGAARHGKNVITLTLGTGVGGALIINGKLYRGSSTTAGEIGHMVVEIDGLPCNCGSRGCLERYVGNRYLVEYALEAKEEYPDSILFQSEKEISPISIEKAATDGDKLAKLIWERAGTYLGIVIAGLINCFNPDVVVIGGGVASAGELIFEPLRRQIAQRAMRCPRETAKIVPAHLGSNAGVIGAATLAMVS